MKPFTVPKYILLWSLTIAILVTIASLLGLYDPAIYIDETTNWASQAQGQDIGNLLAVVSLLISGYFYSKKSYKAALVWIGTLLYLMYAYVVYAVAVHFNGLFLVYVTVLGLSSYALLFTITQLRAHFDMSGSVSVRRFAGYTLAGIGILISFLWLSELIPALLAGTVPASITEAGLWVNPIHVIDLAIVLPAFILSGILALKNKRDGLFFVGPWLVFSALMAASIVFAMIIIGLSDGFSAVLPPLVMVSLVMVLSTLAAWRYLRQLA